MKKIAILTGGPGLEREIALKSAKFFENNLPKGSQTFILPEELENFLEKRGEFEKIIPVFHGEYGEDGKISAFLEILGLKYVFSDYNVHSLLLDKDKTNVLVKELGVRVPGSYILSQEAIRVGLQMEDKNLLSEITHGALMSYPLIFKPNKGGSSFLTYKVHNDEELRKYLSEVDGKIEDDILLQQFIAGEEYSVPVVAGEMLPILKLEKQNKEDFFDYESKYESDHLIKETFPEIENNLKQQLLNFTQKIYIYFGIKGFCRVDYLIEGEDIYFLEVNTIPGMTEASILPKSWGELGRGNEELVGKIISDY